jgi:uncharacterized membrane protein YphA (DoxX/SURF4 family)
MNIILWILQVLLALLFLLAGTMKFVMPVEEMNRQAPIAFPGLFLHFIGTCEVLGALGLLLPSILRIKPKLTPLAAVGLAIITIGATVTTMMGGMMGAAMYPLVICLLCLFVAYGRWRLAPIASK